MARMVNADELAAALRADEIFSVPKDYWKSVFGVPIVDAEVVVRCKECHYRSTDGDGVPVCTGAMAYVNTPDDWYCASGEREGGDE